MADTPRTMATVTRLHDLGVSLSLDDFGTGYSSLSYLRRLPVTELKIDRSFVANVVLDAHDEVIVRSTIELGHNLGLRVVAEGVENDPVLEHLRGLGCDLGQGYGISRPLDGEMFRRWLGNTPHHVQRTEQARHLTVVRSVEPRAPVARGDGHGHAARVTVGKEPIAASDGLAFFAMGGLASVGGL